MIAARFVRAPEHEMCVRFRAVRRGRVGIDGRSQQIDRTMWIGQLYKLLREADARSHARHRCGLDLPRVCAIEQGLPRLAARGVIASVVLDLGDTLQKYRVRSVLRVESLNQFERSQRLMFVPEIQPVQLEVGFAAQERALFARALHLA